MTLGWAGMERGLPAVGEQGLAGRGDQVRDRVSGDGVGDGEQDHQWVVRGRVHFYAVQVSQTVQDGLCRVVTPRRGLADLGASAARVRGRQGRSERHVRVGVVLV